MNLSDNNTYAVPASFRRMENMHVVFWLFKDISWCMIWEELGVIMIIPTLSIAIWISWKNKHIKSELAHNLAIVFWISANSYWMISEFMAFDEMDIWGEFTGKHISLIPFLAGVLILTWYYLVQRPKEIRLHKAVTM
jgi:hypothetical protein